MNWEINFLQDCVAPYSVILSVYVVVSGAFTLIDLYKKPRIIYNQKMQKDKIDADLVIKHVPNVVFNLLITGALFELLVYALRLVRGCHRSDFTEFSLYYLVLTILTENVVFYYVHRLLHSKALYRKYHKHHHLLKAPFAVTSFYGNPVDHVGQVCIPFSVSPLIAGANTPTIMAWYVLRTFFGIWYHCGYDLPLIPSWMSPKFHDYHHEKSNKNYGSFLVLDWIHGTLGDMKK